MHQNNDYKTSLTKQQLENLEQIKTPPTELKTKLIDQYDLIPELLPYSQLSWEEECESSSLQPRNFYNYMIKPDEIDYIFPANDKDIFQTLHAEDFLSYWDTSYLDDRYWDFVAKLDSESKKDVRELQAKFNRFNGIDTKKKSNRKLSGSRYQVNKYFDFNGLTSDLTHYSKNVESAGNSGLYWHSSDDCIHHKGCDVYPIHRILQKSKIITCDEILTEILPSLYECVSKYGKKCENIIDSGYYRVIMKTIYPKTGEEIVIKMMKSKSIKKERDLIRHIRESILLGHLYDLEQEWVSNEENYDKLFTQKLSQTNGEIISKKRGFNYVEEYGHCVTPLWISISPLYKIALDKWILNGFAKLSKLSKLIFMSLQIAYSVELIHTIPGGPFHHTDIQPRQFLLDENDYIYINDFNRGKFQPYYFGDGDNDKIEKCWYCGHRSRGHWRAPEEPKKRPLNEKLDIFSMGLTIWSLYSNDIPFRDATFDDLTYLYYDLRRIPEMTPNIPPAIKDIIRSCLKWDPRQRPTATQVVNMFEDIYFLNLKTITEGFYDLTSYELMKANTWIETNYPPKSKRKSLPQ